MQCLEAISCTRKLLIRLAPSEPRELAAATFAALCQEQDTTPAAHLWRAESCRPLLKVLSLAGYRHSIWWDPVNLGDLQQALDQRKLNPNEVITMKALRDAGVASKKIDFGVKLLARVRSCP